MDDKKFLKLIDNDGNMIEYEVIMAFKWWKTKKNYIVYTDNTKDKHGALNIYAAIYYPNDSSRLDAIETDEEWDQIDERLKELNGGE